MAIFGKDITAADLAVGNLQGSEKEASEFGKALRFGLDQPTENVATTLKALGFDTQADTLSGLVDAPENYESAAARFMNPEGEGLLDFSYKDLPLAIVEQAGQLGGSMLSRAGGFALAGPVGALLGPALFEAVQIAGPVALERARNNGRTEPNWEDWSGALGTSAFSGALNAVGVQGIGKLNSTIAGSAFREGVTEGLQGATEQVGGTGLTQAGLQIDPKQVIGEGLIGGSTGASAQVPTSAIQNIRDLLPTQRPTTAPMAVRGMQDTTDPDRLQRREQIQEVRAGIERFEQEVPQADQENIQEQLNDEEIQRAFVEAQGPYIRNHIARYYGATGQGVQLDVINDVQEYIQTNYPLFDPRIPENTESTIADRIAGQIDAQFEIREQIVPNPRQAVEEGDKRFEAPLNTEFDIYSEVVPQTAVGPPARVPKVLEGPRAGITSLETQIDPVFMTKRVSSDRIDNLPNSPMKPDFAMKQLGIKEVDNKFVYEPTKAQIGPEANELINMEVAPFLDYKERVGETVTKDEIKGVFNDTLSRFKSVLTEGENTHYKNNYEDTTDLDTLFPEMNPINDSVELWTEYLPRLPEGENKFDSPLFNRDPDKAHNPRTRGSDGGNLFWWRGKYVEDPNGKLGEGLLVHEFQSNVHAHPQSTNPRYEDVTYLSQLSTDTDQDVQEIKEKIQEANTATVAFQNQLANTTLRNDREYPSYSAETNAQAVGSMLGLNDYSPGNISELFFHMADVSPKFNELFKEYESKRDAARIETYKNLLLVRQPFGIAGVQITPEDVDFTDTRFGFSSVRRQLYENLANKGFDVQAEALTNPELTYSMERVKKIETDLYSREQEQDRKFFEQTIRDNLPTIAEQFPAVYDMQRAARNYPSEQEIQRYENFQRTQYNTKAFPDYPFKKNYPQMDLRTAITHAIDTGLNHLIIPEKGFTPDEAGVKGTYNRVKKEAEKIAKQIASKGGPSAKELFTVIPGSQDLNRGPYYQLDLRSLRSQIEAKVFEGFKGYKEGGLVMNYGDYGRSYI
tara:strand:+ start:446 stop:3517 length:3072 start_codon:yes stop_codon:yes gene_type:complete